MDPHPSTDNGSTSHDSHGLAAHQHATITAPTNSTGPEERSSNRTNARTTTAVDSAPPCSVLRPPHPLTTRYSRQLLLPQLNGLTGQTRLANSRVLIIGLGGLGCPAALYLAAAGIGTLGFVDGDVVEESNLHRQVLHTEGRVGRAKVESAREGVRQVNSACRVLMWRDRVVGARDVLGILEGRVAPSEAADGQRIDRSSTEKVNGTASREWDLVLDCTDNPATRYAINDAAILAGVPIVSGAAQRGEGMLMVLNFRWCEEAGQTTGATTTAPNPASTIETDITQLHNDAEPTTQPSISKEGRGPCYRCIFPHPPDPSTVQSCSEIGVLGTAVGTIGVLMAQEAIKLLVKDQGATILKSGDDKGKRGEMLIFNAFSPQGFKGMWRGVGLRGRREGCVSCGPGEKSITRREVEEGRLDYQAFCGRVEDVRVLSRERGERVGAGMFLEELESHNRGPFAQAEQQKESRSHITRRIVDVREEIEVELGSRLEGAINVPFSKILRDPEGALMAVACNATGHDETLSCYGGEKVYFVCHRGNDSQIAAKRLMEMDEKLGRQRAWIGDVEGGFVAMEHAQWSGGSS